jgi:hypothetical protein
MQEQRHCCLQDNHHHWQVAHEQKPSNTRGAAHRTERSMAQHLSFLKLQQEQTLQTGLQTGLSNCSFCVSQTLLVSNPYFSQTLVNVVS